MAEVLPAGVSPGRRTPSLGMLLWLGAGIAVALSLILRDAQPWLQRPPDHIQLPLASWLEVVVVGAAERLQRVLRGMATLLDWPIRMVREFLIWLPWAAAVLISAAIGYSAGGRRIAIFTAAGLLYIVVSGYWHETMVTLAIVGVAVPISVVVGLALGIAMHRSSVVLRVVEPLLDVMQTVPTFAYLVPILVLFGLGPVVGMIASAIYALPPMARSTRLALDRVPAETVEAGRMSGSTEWQLLRWIQLPSAMAGILLGVNQAIMAVLSMVVIASILGGTPDIGWEVFNTMKKAQFGESILAGLVIVIVAMILDRISRGFALGNPSHGSATDTGWTSPRLWSVAGLAAVAAILTADFVPVLRQFPVEWEIYPAAALNAAVEWFAVTFYPVTQALKDWTVLYVLLPLKIGYSQSVSPQTWGFAPGPEAVLGYVLVCTALILLAGLWRGYRAGIGVAILGVVYFHGTTGLPWTAIVVLVGVLAFQAAGAGIGALAVTSLGFVAVSGLWEPAMITIQLCGAGVLISFLLGTAFGLLAALDDRVSAILRPVSDTLQTMPIFVFLIPAIMVFLVGEFTALVAIVLYAAVPAARFTEHGIRSVSALTLEAATSCGATARQRLLHVQLPLALPEMMLGLNQTIMMSLAMVIVAALAGARGLGQSIMIALTWLAVGDGLSAGLCVALVGITADRILQAWSSRKKMELGLT